MVWWKSMCALPFKKEVDILFVMTDKDNINLMIAQWVKKKFPVKRVITEVHDSILAGLYKELGVETVCPTDLVLKELIGDDQEWLRGRNMYIIIVGAGKVGYHLGKFLMAEGHEVMLIEEDRSKIDTLSLEFHESIMVGDGSAVEVLKEAGANRADVIVAVTGNDEDNLVICQVAKLVFLRPRTIARVNNPRNEDLFTGLGVDASVSATKIINADYRGTGQGRRYDDPLAHIERRGCGDC